MNLLFAGSSTDKQFIKARRFGDLTPVIGPILLRTKPCQNLRTGKQRGAGIFRIVNISKGGQH
jgi:hypothetical protein